MNLTHNILNAICLRLMSYATVSLCEAGSVPIKDRQLVQYLLHIDGLKIDSLSFGPAR